MLPMVVIKPSFPPRGATRESEQLAKIDAKETKRWLILDGSRRRIYEDSLLIFRQSILRKNSEKCARTDTILASEKSSSHERKMRKHSVPSALITPRPNPFRKKNARSMIENARSAAGSMSISLQSRLAFINGPCFNETASLTEKSNSALLSKEN